MTALAGRMTSIETGRRRATVPPPAREVVAPMQGKRIPVEDRLWPKVVEDPSGCWVWTGLTNAAGYGSIGYRGKNRPVHRVAYELVVGKIPEGLHIDHLCRNPPCVNPAHLEPVTQKENTLRGVGFAAVNAAKTHCDHGHPFSGYNLIRDARGRVCRKCKQAAERRAYERQQERAGAGYRRRADRECVYCGGRASVLVPSAATELDVDAEFSSEGREMANAYGDPVGVACWCCARRVWGTRYAVQVPEER